MNKPHTPSPRASRGYTLVELMVTLAILSTLLTLAVSGAMAVANSMRLTATTNSFLAQLHLTRSEAIKRNARVAMCKSSDGVQCANEGGWEQGAIVFHDANNNAKRDPQEDVIWRAAEAPKGFRIAGNKNVAGYVSFGSQGGTLLMSGAFQAGTVVVCNESASDAREVIISAAGRPRIRKTTVAACA